MESFYIYIGQVNIALGIFCLLYRILFARDTFFTIRRVFLLSMVGLAFFHPFISLQDWINESSPLPAVFTDYAQMLTYAVSVVAPVEEVHFFTWEKVCLWLWEAGSIILLGRMLIQLFVIGRIILKNRKIIREGMRIVVVPSGTAPFSFFGWVFVHPEDHSSEELHDILLHESVHVRQGHSVDMILGEALRIVFWFNPAVWLLRKDIRQNLEFLADKNVVNTGCDRKNYQYHLLQLSHQATAVPIVNNFNVSQLKKRIMMMNKKKTSRIGLLKYTLLLPVTVVLVLAGNAETLAGVVTEWTLPVPAGEAGETLLSGRINGPAQENKEEKSIRGRVVDENGHPISAASIIIKNSVNRYSSGTLSDKNGNFVLKGVDSGILCFSYVGRETREIPYTKGMKELKVVMNKAMTKLDELVVVGYATNQTEKKPEPKEKEIFVIVEDMPRFKEGELAKFLARTINYPKEAQEKGIEGKVYVSFIIDKTGKVVQPKVVKSVNPLLDREAIRVVQTMPDWKPGKQRGIPVDVQFTLPIDFKLEKVNIGRNVAPAANGGYEGVSHGASEVNDKYPLYVLDGVIMPHSFDIRSIPVDNIKSIEILKGEVAARYGEAGKNGVILITTLKGSSKTQKREQPKGQK